MSEDLENVDQPEETPGTGRRLSRRTMIAGTAGATAAMWAAPAVTSLSRALAGTVVGSCPPGAILCAGACCPSKVCGSGWVVRVECLNDVCEQTVIISVCYPYACNPTTNACYTSCTNNAQCFGGFVCRGNACVLPV